MDVSAVNSILSTYQNLATQGYETDSANLASKLTTRILKNRDSDGDGYLTNSDLSELSSDEFSKLDSDSDGKLGSDELNTAFKDQMDAIKVLTQSGTSTSGNIFSILRHTAAGKLMKAVNSKSATSSTPKTSSGTSGLDITA